MDHGAPSLYGALPVNTLVSNWFASARLDWELGVGLSDLQVIYLLKLKPILLQDLLLTGILKYSNASLF